MFVRKAPAATIETLALAMKELHRSESPIRIIGMRRGEKVNETLPTREDMARAEDLGDHFLVVADNRGLNYDATSKANRNSRKSKTPARTTLVDSLVDEIAELLLTRDFTHVAGKPRCPSGS